MDISGWKFITMVGVASALTPLIIRSLLVGLYKGGGICNIAKTSFFKIKDGRDMNTFQRMNCNRVIDSMFKSDSSIGLTGDVISVNIRLKANSTILLDVSTVCNRSNKSARMASINSFKTLGVNLKGVGGDVSMSDDTININYDTRNSSDRITLKNRKTAVDYVANLVNVINRINGKNTTLIETLSNIFGMEIYKLQYCSHCKVFHDRKEFKDSKQNVCMEHYKEGSICANCGVRMEFTFDNDKVQYCPTCIKKFKGSGKFYDYSAKPNPKFKKNNSIDTGRFYGAEVEIEVNNSIGNTSKDIADIIDSCSDHIYFKHDGSLDNGVEIITHPCTMEYHKKNTCQVLEMTKSIGGYADNNSTCGLHFHVGRNYFSQESIGMLLYLFDFYWNDLVKLSRRKNRDLRWCKRPSRPSEIISNKEEVFTRGMLGSIPKENKCISRSNMRKNGKKYYDRNEDEERYRAINLRPSATIEFRLFDGTLNPVYFLGSLQLCDELANIALSYKDFTKYSLKELLLGKQEELDLMINELL